MLKAAIQVQSNRSIMVDPMPFLCHVGINSDDGTEVSIFVKNIHVLTCVTSRFEVLYWGRENRFALLA